MWQLSGRPARLTKVSFMMHVKNDELGLEGSPPPPRSRGRRKKA